MSYIKCYSHISEKEVEYNLIGVKLKHRVKNADYGTVNNDPRNLTYWNTSPSGGLSVTFSDNDQGVLSRDKSIMFTTTGQHSQGYSASGILESVYNNTNTGRNPLITGMTIHIDDLKHGENIFEAFETETIKVEIVACKLKIKQLTPEDRLPNFYELDGTTVQDIGNQDVIASVYLRYTDKASGVIIGKYNFIYVATLPKNYPIKFSINSELFLIEDLDPRYKSSTYYSNKHNMYFTAYGSSENNGIRIGNSNSTDKNNFVGIAPSILMSEWWEPTGGSYNPHPYYRNKIVDSSNNDITDLKLRDLNTKADVGYFRHMINEYPNEFMRLTTSDIIDRIPTNDRVDLANSNLNSEEYKIITSEGETTTIFNSFNYKVAPILMPCVNPTTLEPVEETTEEGMFISLTEEIFEGTANEPDPEPEPETVEPAVNPETEYTPPLQEAFEEFPYRDSDTISGLEPNYNLFRPSYSNYIFPKYYRDSIAGDSDWESAITFIQEACNPSSFELWGAAFKLITGHPTPGEIISRVYYLPFEYNEIRGTGSAGFYFSAPVYGPVGPVTLGVKTHSEDPSNTGEPIESNVHYYQQIVNRFLTINLGQVTIDRVFNNFLDYSEVNYTLNLPYGAGQVELDPDRLFFNDVSVGNVKLTGVIDFDTGELTIIIQLNGQRYYETTVNIAIDRLASVADNMAAPLAIAKASMMSGAAAGGIARGLVTLPQSGSKPTSSYTSSYKSWYSQLPDDDLMEYEQNAIEYKQNKITQKRQNLITQRR